MRVAEISAPGGPEVLRIATRPEPVPGAGEVLIDVQAAGVNRPDAMQREGRYPPPKGASDIPGLEVAGRVAALGTGVTRWREGDMVMALLSGGGYAEHAVAPEAQCLPIPDGLSVIEGAAIPETFFTVWTNVFERGALKPHETLLVHGGASGIGTTAIQLARAFGSTVYTTAGSSDRCAALEALGAAHAIDYRTDDFAARIASLTAKRGVDVILDIVGGPYLPGNIASLARDGRLVMIGFMGGTEATFDARAIILKRLTITGSTLRIRSVEEKGAIARALEAHVWPLLERRDVRPIIHATFPLEEAADAHRALDEGHVGKIVLTVPLDCSAS
ncbi:MAG: NAD(P)H-quinone oxidoreductase [Acidobacteriota bacterium]|nr:NAD(P)H-quinone oxidoreductase [Acidobacteriota bacterium]